MVRQAAFSQACLLFRQSSQLIECDSSKTLLGNDLAAGSREVARRTSCDEITKRLRNEVNVEMRFPSVKISVTKALQKRL